MGADQFQNKARGKTAKEAFKSATEEARYESGHGGYSGTIAEKHEFKMVTPNAGETPAACIERCMDDDGHWVQDKWGPAACVDLGPDKKDPTQNVYCFFGWASS